MKYAIILLSIVIICIACIVAYNCMESTSRIERIGNDIKQIRNYTSQITNTITELKQSIGNTKGDIDKLRKSVESINIISVEIGESISEFVSNNQQLRAWIDRAKKSP